LIYNILFIVKISLNFIRFFFYHSLTWTKVWTKAWSTFSRRRRGCSWTS